LGCLAYQKKEKEKSEWFGCLATTLAYFNYDAIP
jgi:hypothetical protein